MPMGNTLRVDAVYGNDANAAVSPGTTAFLTISAALTYASSHTNYTNVIVYAGTYAETIVIPTGVSVTGIGLNCVILEKNAVVADTTMIKMNINSTLENVTCNVNSAGNYALVGVEFLTGSSINAHIRSATFNVFSTQSDAKDVIGVLSAGVSSLTYTSSYALWKTIVNVRSSGTGITRGVLVSGANQLCIRVCSINAGDNSAGTNVRGVETTHASALVILTASTVRGYTSDISRTLGSIQLGNTDLLTNSTNAYSFTALTESNTMAFGIIGNLANNTTYYLVPGVQKEADVLHTIYHIPINRAIVLFCGIARFTGTLATNETVGLTIYKTTGVTTTATTFNIVHTATSGETVSNAAVSVDFAYGDTLSVNLTTVHDPGDGYYSVSLGFY